MSLNRDLIPSALREIFGHFPSGVAALCSTVGGAPQGIVASTFTVGVSLDPPLVMFAAQNSSRTWPLLRDRERIGVSVLAADQADICRQIAAKTGDRFAGARLTTTASGAAFLEDAVLWLDCSVETQTPAGDHTVVLLRVHGYCTRENRGDPLIFHASDFRSLQVHSFA
ncbi:flavin reductase family protein [Arthrobacter sp. NA-172]|uniref:flavin reductase family protein n=1 Tax=Arthrobacter sp. NA-172 TaxID=3367524 RepID=UPI003754AE20